MTNGIGLSTEFVGQYDFGIALTVRNGTSFGVANLDLRNRAPLVERLPDYRQRVTRVYDVLNPIPKDPAKILADAWLTWGTQDAEYTNCRLILQNVSGQPKEFPEDKKPPYLTRVYEEIAASAETPVGDPDVTFDQYDNQIIVQEYLQFSTGTAIYQIPGVTPAPAPFTTAILKEEIRTNDGTLMRIKRTYTTGGILSDREELKFDGKLLLRTITSLNEVPATPSGFTLVTESTEYVRGLKVYSYSYASASSIIGLGGEISRSTEYNLSPDQGVTGVTVTTITYLTDTTVTSNPITGPVGSELINVSYTDNDGYRTWRAVYASGQGVITSSKNISEGGMLISYSITSINSAPATPSATIGGVVTLVKQLTRNGSDAAAGTVIYDYDWVEANGEVSRAFTNSNGGPVDFNPSAPTASLGPVVCTVRYLTSLAVTSDPTTRPPGFVRVAIDRQEQAGYIAWTVRYGYGVGLIVDNEEYRNQGRLTVFSRTSLGAPPEAPSPVLEGQIDSITLTDGGSGYTSPPTISFSGGGGTGAIATAVLEGASVASVTLLSAGTGYISAPTVFFTGGGGSGATATALLVPTTVASASLTGGGSGYSSAPTVLITGGGGSGATATATVGGGISGMTLLSAGTGYVGNFAVVFSGGGGSGAQATAIVQGGVVVGFNVDTAGSGYTSPPTVTLAPPSGGSGATASVSLSGGVRIVYPITGGGYTYPTGATIVFTGGGGTGAAGKLVVDVFGNPAYCYISNCGTGYTSAPAISFTGGTGSATGFAPSPSSASVASVTITNPGSGYTSTPTISFSGGGGTGAAATAILTPTGVASVSVAAPGTGYTSVPSVGFTGGGGSGASASAVLDGAPIASITLVDGGSGYLTAPTVIFSAGTAAAFATVSSTSAAVVLIQANVRTEDGYNVYDYRWAQGVGVIAESIQQRELGLRLEAWTSMGEAYDATFMKPPGILMSRDFDYEEGFTRWVVVCMQNSAGTDPTLGQHVASLVITDLGNYDYGSAPTITISGGGGSGATAIPIMSAGTAGFVTGATVTNGGSGYTSPPLVTVSGGTSDVPQFVALLDNIAVKREKLLRFTYPGRAQAVILQNPTIVNGYNLDIQLSPPIDTEVIGGEEISYSTENTISNLTYPYYTPLEWATVVAQYRGSNGPTSEIQGLRGYRAIGGISSVDITPGGTAQVSVLGHPLVYGASESAFLKVFGGPDAPDGVTFTLEAEVELAFVAYDGTQYFRRTVGFAVIPAQNDLPTLTSSTMLSTSVTSIATLKAVVTVGAAAGSRTNAFRYVWNQGGVLVTRYVRPTLVSGALSADTTFWIKPTDYSGGTPLYWVLA